MKKAVCLLLCLALCLPVFLTAGAETAGDAVRSLDQTLARWSLAMTAQLMGSACDTLYDYSNPYRAYYNSFSQTDFLNPYKVIVVDLTAEQAAAARQALGAQSTPDIAPALAEYLNLQFSQTYAEAVSLILPETQSAYADASALVLLPYEKLVAAVCFDAYAARSAFIISMESSSRGLNEGDIAAYAGEIGVSGLTVRVYEDGDMADLLSLKAWQGTYYDETGVLTSALAKSEGRMRQLFPLTVKALGSQFVNYILSSYLKNFMNTDLTGAARLVSGIFLPLLAESDPEAAAAFMQENKSMIDTGRDERRPPEIAYEEEVKPDPNATYIFVIELHNPERGTESFFDPVLEAALPVKNIPDTPETADYIIRCKVTYSDTPDLSNSNSAVYCPTTEITVHDARTGALVCNLGSVVRPRPAGVVMVSKGNTYYYPYLDQIWEKAQTIFAAE